MSRRTRQSSRVATGPSATASITSTCPAAAPPSNFVWIAVERVARRLAVELEDERVLHAAALAAIRRIGQVAQLPPRVGPREHARRRGADSLVDRGEHVFRLLERDQPRRDAGVGWLAQAGVAARQRHLAGERRHAVAEPAVDDLLRGPERSDRLTALADVLELGAHHRREDAAATMRGQDADDGDAAAANRAARDRQLERERARAADDPVAVERRVHPLQRQHFAANRCAASSSAGSAAEVVRDRADGVA